MDFLEAIRCDLCNQTCLIGHSKVCSAYAEGVSSEIEVSEKPILIVDSRPHFLKQLVATSATILVSKGIPRCAGGIEMSWPIAIFLEAINCNFCSPIRNPKPIFQRTMLVGRIQSLGENLF